MMFKYTSHKLSLLQAHLLPGYYHYVLYTYRTIDTASPCITLFFVSRKRCIVQNYIIQIYYGVYHLAGALIEHFLERISLLRHLYINQNKNSNKYKSSLLS